MIDSKDVGATKKPWIVWGLLVGLLFLGISLIWIGQRDRDSGSRWQEKLDRELVSLYRSQLEHRLKWISLKGGTGHPDSGLFAKILHFDWGNYSAIGLEFSEKGAAEDDIRFVLAPSDFARPGFLVDGTGGGLEDHRREFGSHTSPTGTKYGNRVRKDADGLSGRHDRSILLQAFQRTPFAVDSARENRSARRNVSFGEIALYPNPPLCIQKLFTTIRPSRLRKTCR